MKYLTSIWTCIVLALLLVGIRVYDPLLVEQLRLNSFDQYIRSMPDSQAEGVILLNIGEESLAELGQYPFPRQTYAQIISGQPFLATYASSPGDPLGRPGAFPRGCPPDQIVWQTALQCEQR